MVNILKNAYVLVNGADLSGQSNKFEVMPKVKLEDATTFASGGWKEMVGGLVETSFDVDGLWAAGDGSKPDDRLFTDLGRSAAWTAAPTGAEGGPAMFGNVVEAELQELGQVGNLAAFAAKGSGTGVFVDGRLVTGPGTARTVTGTGTAYQLGALSATQYMRAALHVVSSAGAGDQTIAVTLQSATTSGGVYTDRITFSTFGTTIGSQIAEVAGAITATWWRASWTITGTGSPSFLVAVAAGIHS